MDSTRNPMDRSPVRWTFSELSFRSSRCLQQKLRSLLAVCACFYIVTVYFNFSNSIWSCKVAVM